MNLVLILTYLHSLQFANEFTQLIWDVGKFGTMLEILLFGLARQFLEKLGSWLLFDNFEKIDSTRLVDSPARTGSWLEKFWIDQPLRV